MTCRLATPCFIVLQLCYFVPIAMQTHILLNFGGFEVECQPPFSLSSRQDPQQALSEWARWNPGTIEPLFLGTKIALSFSKRRVCCGGENGIEGAGEAYSW